MIDLQKWRPPSDEEDAEFYKKARRSANNIINFVLPSIRRGTVVVIPNVGFVATVEMERVIAEHPEGMEWDGVNKAMRKARLALAAKK